MLVNKKVLLALALFSGGTYAENFICGRDIDGDGYSDKENEVVGCFKDDFEAAMCPMQLDTCTEKPVAEITKTQCQAHEVQGAQWWDYDPDFIIEKEVYAKITNGEITGIRGTGFTKEATASFRKMLPACGQNELDPTINVYKYTVDRYYPSGWLDYQYLSDGYASIRTVSSDFTETGCSYEDPNSPSWVNYGSYQSYHASQAFTLDSRGIPTDADLPTTATLNSVSYYVRNESTGTANDGVYVKGVWSVHVPQVCEFEDMRSTFWESPWGEEFVCGREEGVYVSSPNLCVDTDTATPEEYSVSGDMLTNDGDRDGEGNCLDEMQLYVGRGQRCAPAGASTAYQNCCSFDGEIMNENVGSAISVAQAYSTIKNLYLISKAAYTAYAAATATGATAAAATTAATTAATSEATALYNPTTIAIGVAIYLVMEWVNNACDQQDFQTAASKAMGHCVEVGEYCSTKWPFVGCVQRQKSFCCFNGKMQRIFHEQGRPQLTTFNGWGTPKNPQCRGFTPEEFQALDFSKIDLSEFYEDLAHNSAETVQSTINDKSRAYYDAISK